MNSILLGKLVKPFVDKETKRTIKWEIIAGPEVPHSEQIAIRLGLTASTTNEDYSEVELFRVDADARIKQRLVFQTKEQAAATAEQRAKDEARIDAEIAESRQRQKQIEADAQAEADLKKEQELAKLNKQHDEWRKQTTVSPAA